MGPYPKTAAGTVEHRLPTLVTVWPNPFLQRHPKVARNLHANQQRLITAYDLHHTLRHIASFPQEPAPRPYREHSDIPDNLAGSTLHSLMTPVPADRTCAQARIPKRWCVCHGGVLEVPP
eukprot:TRINITY_DN5566_c0_g1_i3.p1 TRINITY_DN5566_c0_g1~~TRINITY_DN5566_c0_g1_i3.p1  ORF type:complete len:120 (+),score=11.08 TRINITY_DN5566_c0_g1_i3:641-1000(+)